MSDPVLLSVDDGVATVTLNRVKEHNSFDAAAGEAFIAVLGRVAADPAVRVTVIGAKGPSFSAGGDFNWVLTWPSQTPAQNKAGALVMTRAVQAVYDMPMPTIARVQGAAVGGGVGVALACDYVVASDRARFGLTSVRNGLLAGIAITVLIQTVGPRKARQLLMHGGIFDVEEARRIGMVDRVAAPESLDIEVAKLAAELKLGAPSVQALIKRLVTAMDAAPNDAGMVELVASNVAEQCLTPDAQEGMAAFLQKRKPRWVT
ncbi:MAG: enoyl-CoA hydratase/isomerase family protein [Rhodospirillales bacterium]|nr:MAG: enoyl-CoA hydratase/isomerase family protein [Rhodospirillales bacterium]